jgi:hypothetical protein
MAEPDMNGPLGLRSTGARQIAPYQRSQNYGKETSMRSFLMIAGLAGLLASSAPAFAAGGPGHANPSSADRNPMLLAEDHHAHGWNQWNGSNQWNGWDRSSRWNDRDDRSWSDPWNRDGDGRDSRWRNPNHYRPDGAFSHDLRRILPQRVIHARLRDQRFHDLDDWQFRSGFYRVSAEDRYGRDVKLIVDAHDGRVVKIYRD